MKKVMFIFLLAVLFVQLSCFSQETVTIATYYPAPSGAYKQLTSNYLKFNPQSEIPSIEIGKLYWDDGTTAQTQGAGFYYYDGSAWNFLGGAGGGSLWTESEGDIYREDGNVGIGTTDPQAQLEIGGTGGLRIKPDPGIAPNVRLVSESAGNRQSVINFAMKSEASEFLLWTLGSDVNLENTTNFSIHDSQAGRTRLYIDPAGNVGIGTGTTTPASRLEVNGVVTATGFSCAGCLGVPEISQTEFQRRLTGDCPLNNYMFGIEEDGDVKCRPDQTGAGGGGITSINGTTQSVINFTAGAGISITDNNFDTITIATTGGGGGDNLGNHTATQNIKLDGKWLSGDGANEGVFVKGDGNVGIGTTDPISKFDIMAGAGGGLNEAIHIRGGAQQLNSGPSIVFVNNWGDQPFYDNNKAGAIGAVLPLSGGYFGALVFLTNDGSTLTGITEKMRILHNGNVGIGTTSPGENLEIEVTDASDPAMTFDSDNNEFTIGIDSNDSDKFKISDSTALGTNDRLTIDSSGNVVVSGSVTASGFLYSSDERLKEDIDVIKNPLEKILSLEGVSFKWKDNGKRGIGLVAQDVEKIFPELVHTDENGLKSVEYGNLVAPLIEAIKEQQKQIEELKVEIIKLKKNK